MFCIFHFSIKCDAGKAAGTGDVSKCELCNEGRYRNAIMSAATCEICPTGWSSDPGSIKCGKCECGKYDNVDYLYYRSAASSEPLKPKEIFHYIRDRFPNHS